MKIQFYNPKSVTMVLDGVPVDLSRVAFMQAVGRTDREVQRRAFGPTLRRAGIIAQEKLRARQT